MKRLLPVALAALIASFFLSIAVAWICSVMVVLRPDVLSIGNTVRGGESWELCRMSGPGLTVLVSTRAKRTRPIIGPPEEDWPRAKEVLPAWGDMGSETAAFADLPTTNESVFEHRVAVAAGWPFRCVWCGARTAVGPLESQRELPATGFFRTSAAPLDGGRDLNPRVLPYRPIWSGLAANTLLCAAAMFAIFFGAGWLRRLVRRRRGRCERCGYRCGKAARCPECGHDAQR